MLPYLYSARNRTGAVRLEEHIKDHTGIHIPHNTIHEVLRDYGLAVRQSKKSGRRRWIRYQRACFMRHTDCKQLDDGR